MQSVYAQDKHLFPIQTTIVPEAPTSTDNVEVTMTIDTGKLSEYMDVSPEDYAAFLYYSNDEGISFHSVNMDKTDKKKSLAYTGKIPPQEPGKEILYFVSWGMKKPVENTLDAFFSVASFSEIYCQSQPFSNPREKSYFIVDETFSSDPASLLSSAGIHCDSENLYIYLSLKNSEDKSKAGILAADIVNPDYKEPDASFLLNGFMAVYSPAANMMHFTIDYPRELPPTYPNCGFYQVATFKKGPLQVDGFECAFENKTLFFKIPLKALQDNPSKLMQLIYGGTGNLFSGTKIQETEKPSFSLNSVAIKFQWHTYGVQNE